MPAYVIVRTIRWPDSPLLPEMQFWDVELGNFTFSPAGASLYRSKVVAECIRAHMQETHHNWGHDGPVPTYSLVPIHTEEDTSVPQDR